VKEGKTLMEAVLKTVEEKLIGQWGLVILDRQDSSKMIVCRNGSPILVGLGEDSIYVASEKIGFERHT